MANCHQLFQAFQVKITVGSAKKDKMEVSKEALRDLIRDWFKENHPDYEPKFHTQGSHVMGTGIRTEEDICDLDDGIYFLREPDVTGTTLQSWVWQAVDGYTSTKSEHRKKCVRTIFVKDYEIDHPIYYQVGDQDYKIAVKDKEWEYSDPLAVIEWFETKKDNAEQLVYQVMYLKCWCDHMSFKMPSGLAMTILASNAIEKIVLNNRHDITLRDILKEIKKALDVDFKCVVPAVPNDNLFEDYDPTRTTNFLTALSNFIDDAERALREENPLKASKLWLKHLGGRFPLGEDKDEESRLKTASAMGALPSKPWGNE